LIISNLTVYPLSRLTVAAETHSSFTETVYISCFEVGLTSCKLYNSRQ